MKPFFITFLITVLCSEQILNAQAFCALRDPLSMIQTLVPEASGHRSITRIVDNDARETISRALPFTIHYNELGKHTLYV